MYKDEMTEPSQQLYSNYTKGQLLAKVKLEIKKKDGVPGEILQEQRKKLSVIQNFLAREEWVPVWSFKDKIASLEFLIEHYQEKYPEVKIASLQEIFVALEQIKAILDERDSHYEDVEKDDVWWRCEYEYKDFHYPENLDIEEMVGDVQGTKEIIVRAKEFVLNNPEPQITKRLIGKIARLEKNSIFKRAELLVMLHETNNITEDKFHLVVERFEKSHNKIKKGYKHQFAAFLTSAMQTAQNSKNLPFLTAVLNTIDDLIAKYSIKLKDPNILKKAKSQLAKLRAKKITLFNYVFGLKRKKPPGLSFIRSKFKTSHKPATPKSNVSLMSMK